MATRWVTVPLLNTFALFSKFVQERFATRTQKRQTGMDAGVAGHRLFLVGFCGGQGRFLVLLVGCYTYPT